MIRIIVFLVFGAFFMLSSCKKKGSSLCKLHQFGTFEMLDTSTGRDIIYTITRENNLQIERNDLNDDVATYKVKWLNDCTYSLTLKEGPTWLQGIWGTRVLTVQILDPTTEQYAFRAKFSDSDQIISNTIKKIN